MQMKTIVPKRLGFSRAKGINMLVSLSKTKGDILSENFRAQKKWSCRDLGTLPGHLARNAPSSHRKKIFHDHDIDKSEEGRVL